MKVLSAILSEDDLENLRNYRIIDLKSRESDDPSETPESLDIDFLSKPKGTEITCIPTSIRLPLVMLRKNCELIISWTDMSWFVHVIN